MRISTRSSSPGCSCSTWGPSRRSVVYDQNGNGRLDAADHITFYAAAVPSAYRKYARYNVYWLADAGSASPLRMATVDGTPSGGALAASHLATARHELDQIYLQSALGADAMDRWIFSSIAMGAGFAGGGVAKDFTLSLPGALAAGDLTIRMYSPYELAHETSVSVNGSGVGSADLERDRVDGGGVPGGEPSGRGQHGVALVHGVARQDRDGLVRGGLRAQFCGRRRTA